MSRTLAKLIAACRSKHRFDTEDEAKAHPASRESGMTVFRCPVCSDFHLGHRNPGRPHRRHRGPKR